MEVNRHAKNCTRICGQFFRPGLNHIEPHRVDHILEDRGFKAEIKSKRMEIIGGKAKVPLKGSNKPVEVKMTGPEPGEEMKALDMIALVEQTFDPDVLDRFETIDSRVTVRRAIHRQREALESPLKDAESIKTAIVDDLAHKVGDQ